MKIYRDFLLNNYKYIKLYYKYSQITQKGGIFIYGCNESNKSTKICLYTYGN